MVPGDTRPPYTATSQARQVLNDAEDDLRDWQPDLEGDDGRFAVQTGNGTLNANQQQRGRASTSSSDESAQFRVQAESKGKETATDTNLQG